MSPSSSTRPGVRAALAGGLAAAGLDFAAAVIRSGKPPVRIGQSIATGLQGQAAFDGGVVSALLGAAAHTVILLLAAAIYVLAARRMDYLWRNPAVCGPLFGVIVYALMNAVVVPFSAATQGHPTDAARAVMIGIHIVCVGLPIALAAWKIR